MVGLDQQQVIPTPGPDLPAELPLTEARIPGQDTAVPVDLGQQRWGHRQFGLGSRVVVPDWLGGQHEAEVVAEGAQGVDWTTARLVGQPSPVGFAVDGHALGTGLGGGRGGERRHLGGQRRRQGVAVKLAEEALQGRLARGATIGEAQRVEQPALLTRPPLGDGQDGVVVGQQRRHRQGQDRRQGIGDAGSPAWSGHRGECRR